MSDMKALTEKLDEIGRNTKATQDQTQVLEGQIKSQGEASSDQLEKLDKMDKEFVALKEQQAELEKALAKARSQRNGQEGEQKSEAELEHEKAFEHWCRNPKDEEAKMALKHAANAVAVEARENGDHVKAVTLSGSSGAIPTSISDRILQQTLEVSPFRQFCNVQMVENENFKFPVTLANAAGGWAGAGGSRSDSATPGIQGVTLTYGTVYAYPKIEEEALNDIGFNVVDWLVDVVSNVHANLEGAAFAAGNGSDKPTGLTGTTPETLGDSETSSPLRAFGALQYFPTGAAADFQADMIGAVSSPVRHPAGVLFDTVYGLQARYRANARWALNRTVLAKIRKMRDIDGNYLYIPGLVAGQPDQLLGYPLFEAEDMPDVGSNTYPVAFGDWNRGYQIGDIIATMRMTMDDNITAPGFVKFYARRRVGGKVLDDNAIKLIKCATS